MRTKFSPEIKDHHIDLYLAGDRSHSRACQTISTHRTEDPREIGEVLFQDKDQLVIQCLMDRLLCLILTNRCLKGGISLKLQLSMAIFQANHLLPLSRLPLREPIVLNSWSQ